MRRILLSIILLAFVFPLTRSATAQSNAKCDPASVIATANNLKSTGDKTKDMRILYSIAASITDMDIACNGMVFKGKGDKVLDPITIPKGFYKVTVETSGFFIMDFKTLGSCESSGSTNLFNATPADIMNPKPEKHETTFDVQSECRVVLKSSNTQGKDWILTFDLIE